MPLNLVVPENAKSITFPEFYEALKRKEELPDHIIIGSEEKKEMEDWIWENIFNEEGVGKPGAWLYEHMERTSKVLEAAGINKHDYEHAKTVMVNACLIFLSTHGLFLKQRYNLNNPGAAESLQTKLAVIAVAALFHDIGYLECIDDPENFQKKDLDDHPKIGADITFAYAQRKIAKPLQRAREQEGTHTQVIVKKLLQELFQPELANNIENMGDDEFFKQLRKVKAAISSHDSPEKQNGTDEAAKLDNLFNEAIAVYLADKTHVGGRSCTGTETESAETILSDDISIVHDRITYLIKEESFAITYKPEVTLQLKLKVDIPPAYRDLNYDESSFQADFQRGFTKRYQHAERVLQRLMQPDHLQHQSAHLIINVDFGGGNIWQMSLAKTKSYDPSKFIRSMK